MDELTKDQISMLKSAFDAFDNDKVGYISVNLVGSILEMLGQNISDEELQEIIDSFDTKKTGQFTFENFKTLAARFLIEDEDIEAIRAELREAFRLYDKEGNGYITTDVLREILKELDNDVSPEDLDDMIDEIDADGSGTVDFEEFMQVMTG